MQIANSKPHEFDSGESALPFPRLAVSDLLILTLTVSFSFACDAPGFHDAFTQSDLSWPVFVPDLIDTFVRGILLFGLIVLARERIRGSTRPLAPGHWILLAIGPFAMWVLLAGALRPILTAYWFYDHPGFHAADEVLCAVLMVISILTVTPALRVLQARWIVCVSLVLLSISLVAAWCLLEAAFFLGYLKNPIWRRHVLALAGTTEGMILVTALTAVVIDTFHRIRRDWLHFVGISAAMLNAASCLMHWRRTIIPWWQELWLRLLP